ncbi:MAG TPA: hypothetical protein VFH48_32880 [Chloroflexota bacterium]|nr:hypothetical protein [Chloroflexota bacterium]
MVITYRSGNASDGSTATLTECQSMIVALIGEGLTKQEIIGWIADLRARLDRGDLATWGPVDVGHGTDVLPAQDTIRIMLADLDGFDEMTPEETNASLNVVCRDVLLTSFRILRTLIG